MPRGPLPDEIQQFLAAARPAVLGDSWYTHVSLECTVNSLVEDRAYAALDALALHYTGEPYTDRETPSVAVTATVDRWHTFGEL